VIATGFDRQIDVGLVGGSTRVASQPAAAAARNVIPITQRNPGRAAAMPRTVVPLADGASRRVIPPSPPPQRLEPGLTDMDIPTFIRRQMD
jgi:hypothetical protein